MTKPANLPIQHSAPMGHKVETVYEADGTVVPPSTLANREAEKNKGENPDFMPSLGGTQEEQNAVGKGANPSADVATKNDTTIDPVYIEPSPTADGRVVPETVPASLPVNAPITEPSGEVHKAGEEPKSAPATDGKLVPGKTVPGAGKDGKITPAEIVKPAEVKPGVSDVKTTDSSTKKA